MPLLVSFNNSDYEVGGYEDGDTIDYYGEDRDKLIAHVNKVDPNFPMTFQPYQGDDKTKLVGYFISDDGDEDVTAVMYKGHESDVPIEVK